MNLVIVRRSSFYILLMFFLFTIISKAQTVSPIATPSNSSDGTMPYANLQHTRYFDTNGVYKPKEMFWQSRKLFSLKTSTSYSGQMGPISYFGWLPTGYTFSEPIIANDTLYFSAFLGDGILFSLDTKTGKERWRYKQSNDFLSVATIAGNSVYIGDEKGIFYALDVATSKEKWRYKANNRRFHLTLAAVVDGIVYFNSAEGYNPEGGSFAFNSDENLYALDAQTGQEKWVFHGKGILTSPAIFNDTIFVTTKAGFLYAIDRNSGQEKWKFKANASFYSATATSKAVYFFDDDGWLYAVDSADGKQKWKTNKPTKILTGITVSNGLIFFSGQQFGAYAIDAETGQEKWSFGSRKLCLAPVSAKNVVYFTCEDELYAFEPTTGQQLWKFKSPVGVISAPAVKDGVLYFVSKDGYAFTLR